MIGDVPPLGKPRAIDNANSIPIGSKPKGPFRLPTKNVVRTAIRYTPEGATVDVRTESAGESVRISLQDSGPGVPDELKPKIFQPSFRVDDACDGSRRCRSWAGDRLSSGPRAQRSFVRAELNSRIERVDRVADGGAAKGSKFETIPLAATRWPQMVENMLNPETLKTALDAERRTIRQICGLVN